MLVNSDTADLQVYATFLSCYLSMAHSHFASEHGTGFCFQWGLLSPFLATPLANAKNGDGLVYHALGYTYHRFFC